MATTESPTTWNCDKWADCSCAASGGKCGCGSGCACGSVTVEAVKKAMETRCAKVDCDCGVKCQCKKGECKTGSVDRTPTQWVEYVKVNPDGAGADNDEKNE